VQIGAEANGSVPESLRMGVKRGCADPSTPASAGDAEELKNHGLGIMSSINNHLAQKSASRI
jgi:hypothetical protein